MPVAASDRLRTLLAAPGVIRVAGAHDAMGAKLAVQAGMDAIWSSGFEISTAHAVPDASILTMTEYLAAAQMIADAVAPVPVIADCDTGYGNSNNVIRMVRQFEAAGVAAVCIEDKKYPKTNSFIDGKQELASIAEFVGKILAAKNAQRTSGFAVVARTEALIAGWGVDEALRRCEEYVRAGADALLVHDKSKTGEGVRAFLARWTASVPVFIVPTTFPSITATQAGALGVKGVIYANQGIRAAARAMLDVWQSIARDGSSAAVEGSIATMGTLFEVQGMSAHTEAEREFDRTGPPPTRAVILHAGAHHDEPSLTPLTTDVPLAALDLNGTPLVQRQIALLRQCGINDITVVTGYRHDAVPTDGATRVVNTGWETNGEVGSLLAGSAALKAEPRDARVLVCYGDVLVERTLLERLLATTADCVAVVDRSGATGGHGARVVRDRVTVDDNGAGDHRFLSPTNPRRIRAIGRSVTVAESNGEFAGLLLVSGERWPALRARALKRVSGALPDLLAESLRDGEPVSSFEVTSGWLEVRSFADYERACRMVEP
jgi:phosphoenolpyruvate phosphomutase